MLLTMMKAKLHRATVTQADLEYEGSIAIDRDLLDQSGILPHEQVDVLNITTGARFTTYAIEAPRGSRVIGVNGAAARLVQKGDKVIVVTYCQLPACAANGGVTTVDLLAEAAATKGFETNISCPSKPDGSTSVGWAAGPVKAGEGAAHQPLFYAAVMEGERALPGREIRLRLENALTKAGV